MAATWDSAYLLGLFNRYTSRPTADEVTDPEKYKWLTEAQTAVVSDIAARCPWVLYGAPTLCVTADNKVFTFGTDSNGYAIFPFGDVQLYRSLSDVPNYPMRSPEEYLIEGEQVRIPNDRTQASPIYWRGIQTPADITASAQPSILPEPARDLIALEAARRFTKTLNRPDLADDLQADYNRLLPAWLLLMRRQFSNGGALGSVSGLRAAMAQDP